MKKKTLLLSAIVVSFLMILSGCGESSVFGILVNDDLNIEITAENASEGMTGSTGTLSVEEGDSVLIEPAFEEGVVLVEFFPFNGNEEEAEVEELMPEGEPEFEVNVTGSEPIACEVAAGEYLVTATVKEKANGTAVISTVTGEAGEEQ